MVRLELETLIAAPIQRVFDLARSIDLHMASTNWTGERAVAGVTSGLIGLNQEVWWQGRHFGLMLRHRSRITKFNSPTYFQDCMVRGFFRSFCHDHFFAEQEGLTQMQDVMEFEAPFKLVGTLMERLVLAGHLRDLLGKRNACIRRVAESDEWQRYLPA
jgi:ligand-binding SRPBCC domain-containing protein